jgi:hypothetical protein
MEKSGNAMKGSFTGFASAERSTAKAVTGWTSKGPAPHVNYAREMLDARRI